MTGMVCRPLRPHPPATAGFTLLEAMISLAIIGLIGAIAGAAYLGLFSSNRTPLNQNAELASISGAVVAFAKARHRLPCPDLTGGGLESLSAGACPSGNDVGWVPYLSLGLAEPPALTRAIYGVYRSASLDLTQATEHNGDSLGSPNYADGTDFLLALQSAAQAAVSSSQVYVTGDGASTGAENCTSNVVANPAYIILAPGEDRDVDGQPVDGIDSTLTSGSRCFASPTRAMDSHFDDRTLAVSFFELMSRLNNQP